MKKIVGVFFSLFFGIYTLSAQALKPNPAEKSVTMLVVVLGILILASIAYAIYKKSLPAWLRQILMYAVLIEVIASIYMFTTQGKYSGPSRNYDTQEQASDTNQLSR